MDDAGGVAGERPTGRVRPTRGVTFISHIILDIFIFCIILNVTQEAKIMNTPNTPETNRPQYVDKNTYTIQIKNILCQLSLFSGCASTPLPVATLNGKPMAGSGGWIQSKYFPNPAASKMVAQYDAILPYFKDQEHIASTIIEYLDKDTKQPVVALFPSADISVYKGYDHDYKRHLNFATRQDFERQLKIRDEVRKQMQIAHSM